MVQVKVDYSGNHLAHGAFSLLLSLEDIEVKIIGMKCLITSLGGDGKTPAGCDRDRTRDHWLEMTACKSLDRRFTLYDMENMMFSI